MRFFISVQKEQRWCAEPGESSCIGGWTCLGLRGSGGAVLPRPPLRFPASRFSSESFAFFRSTSGWAAIASRSARARARSIVANLQRNYQAAIVPRPGACDLSSYGVFPPEGGGLSEGVRFVLRPTYGARAGVCYMRTMLDNGMACYLRAVLAFVTCGLCW